MYKESLGLFKKEKQNNNSGVPIIIYTQSQPNIIRENTYQKVLIHSVSKNVSDVYYMLEAIGNKNKVKLWFSRRP